ncbi:MAG: hypothetical protein WBG70_08295 [Spirulinaceae cyanobacterium]
MANTKAEVGAKSTANPDGEEKKPKEKMKRLTLDISESLHRAIKMKSVEEGVPMTDILRELLQKHFGD